MFIFPYSFTPALCRVGQKKAQMRTAELSMTNYKMSVIDFPRRGNLLITEG